MSILLATLVVVSGGAVALTGAGAGLPSVGGGANGMDVANAAAGLFSSGHGDAGTAEFRVTNPSEGATVRAGNRFVVSANVTNVGGVGATQNVTLKVDRSGNGSPEEVEGSKSVTLSPGQSRAVRFEVPVDGFASGSHRYAVLTENDRRVSTLDLRVLRPPTFDVAAVSAPDSVVKNDSAVVSASVLNRGDFAGGQTVTFAVDRDHDGAYESDETVGTASLNVGPGDRGHARFDLRSRELAPGSYTYQVSTRADARSGRFVVKRPATLEVSGLNGSTDVDSGETFAVTAVVGNVGDVAGSTTVKLRSTANVSVSASAANGTGASTNGTGASTNGSGASINVTDGSTNATGGSTNATGGSTDRTNESSVVATKSVALDGGERTTVRFNVSTDGVPAGEYTYGVFANGSGRRSRLRVREASFEVTNAHAPKTSAVGEPFTASATVANVGDANGTRTVSFGIDVDGDSHPEFVGLNQSVHLDAGENTTVEFDVPTESRNLAGLPQDLGAGSYVFGVFTREDNATSVISLERPASTVSTTSTGHTGGDAGSAGDRVTLDEIAQSKYGMYFDSLSNETKGQVREIYRRQPFTHGLALTEVLTREQIARRQFGVRTQGLSFTMTDADAQTQQKIEAEYDAQFQNDNGDRIASWEELARKTYGEDFSALTDEQKQDVKRRYLAQFD
ncbi:MAG: hypothetical protein ABEJ28_13225 [Salinigranum sp.]